MLSKPEEARNASFAIKCGAQTFWKRSLSTSRRSWFTLPLKGAQKRFCRFCGVVGIGEKRLTRFQREPPFANFYGLVWTGLRGICRFRPELDPGKAYEILTPEPDKRVRWGYSQIRLKRGDARLVKSGQWTRLLIGLSRIRLGCVR